MSQNPSGSEVSKVESDIAQTITLADTIVTLIREPVALLYNNITKSQQLKRSLGHWQEEAFSNSKECRIPVLCREEYEAYIVRVDGIITTSMLAGKKQKLDTNIPRLSWGSSWAKTGISDIERPLSGSGCWVYFLYAMGIYPGMDIPVLGWKPSTEDFISTQNGGIEMEIEGSVLCHIINIYSKTLDPNSWARKWDEQLPDRRSQKSCKFPFGELAWERSGGQIHAHFRPGKETELGNTKMPFGKVGLCMEPNTLMISYLTALEHGVSNPNFRLAKSTAPLQERIERFLHCFGSSFDSDDSYHRNLDENFLLSYDWFEEASRVKRRVLARGGGDHTFFDDICEAIDHEPRLPDKPDKDYMKDQVREKFLLNEETFTFWVRGRGEMSEPHFGVWPSSLARGVLEQYQSELPGTWRRTLYDMKDEVLDVLKISRKVIITEKMRLLEFTNTCSLWKELVLLGTPEKL